MPLAAVRASGKGEGDGPGQERQHQPAALAATESGAGQREQQQRERHHPGQAEQHDATGHRCGARQGHQAHAQQYVGQARQHGLRQYRAAQAIDRRQRGHADRRQAGTDAEHDHRRGGAFESQRRAGLHGVTRQQLAAEIQQRAGEGHAQQVLHQAVAGERDLGQVLAHRRRFRGEAGDREHQHGDEGRHQHAALPGRQRAVAAQHQHQAGGHQREHP